MKWPCRVLPVVASLIVATGRLASAADTLAPGQRLTAHVIDAPNTRLQIALDEGSAAELRIEQREGTVDVTFEGNGPERVTVRSEAGRGGHLNTVLVGTARGPWTLSITPRGKRATLDLELGTARAASDADRQRVEAFRQFASAEQLRREHYREEAVKTRTPAIDQQTRSLYASATATFERAQDACGLRLAGIGEARMEVAAGGYTRARSIIDTILHVPCDGDLAEQAQAFKTLGMAAAYQGDFAQSADADEDALRLYRQTGDLFYQGVVLGNLSEVYLALGDTAKALEAVRGALTAAQASNDAAGVVYSRKGIAAVQLARGELAAALATYRQALSDLQKTPLPQIEGETWNDLGQLYHRMADDAASERAYARAQAVWTKIKHTFGTVDTTLNEGEALLDRADRVGATAKFQSALALAERDGLKSPQVRALRGLGAASLAGRNRVAARRYLTRARTLAAEIGERGAESSVLRTLGDLDREERNLAAARDDYERALQLAREAADQDGVATTLGRLARTLSESADLDAARLHIEDALAIIEQQRGQIHDPGLRTSFFSTARDFHDLRIQILMQLDEARPGQGFAAAALGAAEQARARALQDTLYERSIEVRRDVDSALAAAERSAQEALRVAAFRLAKLPPGSDRAGREQAQRVVDDANRALDRVRGEIRGANPRFSQFLRPEPLALDEIQQTLLDTGTAALEYWLGERASYVWVVSPTTFRVVRLPGRAAVERAAAAYRDGLLEHATLATGADSAEALAAREQQAAERFAVLVARSSRTLLGDALRGVSQRTLAVVADGALQNVPFASLRGADGVELARTREFVYLPSLSTLRGLRRAGPAVAAAGRVALFADPVFSLAADARIGATRSGSTEGAADASEARSGATDGSDGFDLAHLRPLPNSRVEARAIAAMLPEDRRWLALDYDATRQAVLATDWRQFSIAHFAAHSLIDLQRPELSGIVLSLYDRQRHSQDGFLRLDDIYNLDMPVQLVVLSTCDSAVGKTIGSEGAFSLARAFFYAGTPRVLASLWPIDDRATARFMELFYRALLVEHQSAPAAVRTAQRQMASDPRWRAPYYWAGFVVQGDWK